jgi:adenylate cyclase
MIEHELTYLAEYLPDDLHSAPSKDMKDQYVPVESDHPNLRIRKNGEKYEITRKVPVKDGDASSQIEETIRLSETEYQAFSLVKSKIVHKTRYQYKIDSHMAEIDVFLDGLAGLVLVDFEFSSDEERNTFVPPDFCLVEVTQEKFIAGGMLCGKTYKDIEKNLHMLRYKKILDKPE